MSTNTTELSHQSRLQPSGHAWRCKQVLIEQILDELDKHFCAMGIRYMPIKGAYLIKSSIAEKMPVRRMDDIDILVEKKDFLAVAQYFVGSNVATFVNDAWPFEKQFTYHSSVGDILLEIGYRINCPERFLLESRDLFLRAPSGDGFCVLPDPVDALLIHVCHLLVHIAFDWRETNFEEMHLLANAPGFSWEEFHRRTAETGIEEFICFIIKRYGKRYPEKKFSLRTGWRQVLAQAYMDRRERGKGFRTGKFLDRLILELVFVRQPVKLFLNKYLQKQ